MGSSVARILVELLSRAPHLREPPGDRAVSSIIYNITFDCADPVRLARFWGQVTGWPVDEDPRPGHEESAVGMAGDGPRLYFVRVPDGKASKNRVHLDVMPADLSQDDEITRLIGLGARVVTDRRPEYGWVLMADPEGNEFDVEISVAELEAAEAAT
jgi:predicted enzyme related to lactoylglutathione lyase